MCIPHALLLITKFVRNVRVQIERQKHSIMRIYLPKRIGQLSKESEQAGKTKKVSLYLLYHVGPDQKREYEWFDLLLFEKPNV